MTDSTSIFTTPITRLALITALSFFTSVAWAGKSTDCYVTGDTGGNDTKKTLGSKENPYGSLAAVEADEACERIVVLWSGTPLDGGIALWPGQVLEGDRGPGGALPVITNSNAARHGGRGVWLSSDNEIKRLHVKNTWHFGIGGLYSGKLKIEKSRVTGSGQVGTPAGSGLLGEGTWPNVLVVPNSDADIMVKHSDFGESAGSGLGVFALAGHSKINIEKVTVSDQGALTDDNWEETPGIAVWTLNDASADVKVKDTRVENIGRGNSNSDGLVLLNVGSGDFITEVDRYSYLNPDGDGGGSATGIEMGMYHAGDATFTATITGSHIEGSTSCGIQVLDLATNLGANRLEVTLEDNQFKGNVIGVCGVQDFTPLSDYSLFMEDNDIIDSSLYGVSLLLGGPNSSYDVFLEGNTIANSGSLGLWLGRYLNDTGSYNVDAGLGALGSSGKNSITGSGVHDVYSYGMDATAANNWWGDTTGPSSIVAENGANVVVDPFLTEDPN